MERFDHFAGCKHDDHNFCFAFEQVGLCIKCGARLEAGVITLPKYLSKENFS